jgi:hypothetical protein
VKAPTVEHAVAIGDFQFDVNPLVAVDPLESVSDLPRRLVKLNREEFASLFEPFSDQQPRLGSCKSTPVLLQDFLRFPVGRSIRRSANLATALLPNQPKEAFANLLKVLAG